MESKMVMKQVLIPVDDVEVVVVIGLLEQDQDFGQLSLEWEEWEPLLGLGLEQEILELGAVRQVPELGQLEREPVEQVRAHGQMEPGIAPMVEAVELGVAQRVLELGRPLREREELELLLGLEEGMVLELGAVQQVPELGQMERGQEAQVRAHG